MIDTMGFIIPIDKKMHHSLASKSLMTQRIDCQDGLVEFEYYNFQSSHSWNYKVRWKLEDRKFCWDPGLAKTVLSSGHPHLRMEFSAPKILTGNNIQTIAEDYADVAIQVVKKKFEKNFNVSLPLVRNWFLTRLDVCANFELENIAQVKDVINYLQRLDYSQKKKDFYEDESLYFASRHSTLKIYSKGPEFKKHDMNRFKNQIESQQLLRSANKIIRVEVELKNRLRYIAADYINSLTTLSKIKLKQWNGYLPYFKMMDLFSCKEELERMISTFMICKETKAMKEKDMHDKLRQNFSSEQADVFMCMHSVILTRGIKAARQIYKKDKMARALRAYRSLGISFINPETPVIEDGIKIPHDFSFQIDASNPYYQVPIKEAA